MLVASVLATAITPIAQASVVTYNVTGVLYEPQTQPLDTIFNGSFDWDGTNVTNLHGTMNSSMYAVDNENPIPHVSYPLMHLDYQLAQSTDGNIVTASTFLKNTTDVFYGGGYAKGDYVGLGYNDFFHGTGVDSYAKNDNAYFTFSFDKTTMTGIVDSVVYGDCTAGGMMGQVCMTGHSPVASNSYGEAIGAGTMSAYPSSISISAVPVPAAVWLFGSALLGMLGVSRKRTLSV